MSAPPHFLQRSFANVRESDSGHIGSFTPKPDWLLTRTGNEIIIIFFLPSTALVVLFHSKVCFVFLPAAFCPLFQCVFTHGPASPDPQQDWQAGTGWGSSLCCWSGWHFLEMTAQSTAFCRRWWLATWTRPGLMETLRRTTKFKFIL